MRDERYLRRPVTADAARASYECMEGLQMLTVARERASPLTPSGDRSLAERIAAGDEAAFAEAVSLYDGDMRRAAYLVCSDADLASDAAQDAWDRLWTRPPKLRNPQSLRGWLVVVATNAARQRARWLAVRQRAMRRVTQTGTYPDPAEAAEWLDIADALRRQPPADRQLVGLRYVLGLSAEEIGDQLHIRPGAVRTRLHRALLRLRKELDHG